MFDEAKQDTAATTATGHDTTAEQTTASGSEPASMATLDLIVVPQSALDAFPDDPHPLVDGVLDYVNFLLDVAKMPIETIPAEARQAYRCDAYHADVCAGGHQQYVNNNRHELDTVVGNLMAGLISMGDAKYQRIAGEMATIVRSDNAKDQPKALTTLDQPFYTHDTKNRFTDVLANWLAHCEILLTVPDDQCEGVLSALAGIYGRASNSEETRPAPLVLDRAAQFRDMLTDKRKLGFGLAGGSVVNPITSLGSVLKVVVDGRIFPTTLITAAQGPCWGVMSDGDAVLLGYVAQEGEEIGSVGSPISRVAKDDIDIVRDICADLQAADVIDAMVRQHAPDIDVGFLSVHAITGDDPDDPTLLIYVVFDGGNKAYLAQVDAQGGALLAEETDEVLTRVSRDQIDQASGKVSQTAA